MDGQVFTHLPFAVFQVVFLPPGQGKCPLCVFTEESQVWISCSTSCAVSFPP